MLLYYSVRIIVEFILNVQNFFIVLIIGIIQVMKILFVLVVFMLVIFFIEGKLDVSIILIICFILCQVSNCIFFFIFLKEDFCMIFIFKENNCCILNWDLNVFVMY